MKKWRNRNRRKSIDRNITVVADAICRATTNKFDKKRVGYTTEHILNGKLVGSVVDEHNTDLRSVIESDKKYGLLTPKNGKSYGYFIINKDVEITHTQARKGVYNALFRWWLELNLEFHRVRRVEDADIKIYFRTEQEDELLYPSTLAYMYYPLGGINNGTCVVNMRYWWTLSGSGVDLHLIDPVNYPEPTGKEQGSSHDLDQVLGHEFGHGILGLPHHSGIMASNYGTMTEHLSYSDIKRGEAKIGRKNMLKRKYERLKLRLHIRSDRE